MMQRHSAELLLLTVTALWGGTFVLVKGAMDHTSASLFVFLRFGIALVLAMAIWPAALRGWTPRLVRHGMILGLLYGTGFMLQTIGLTTTSASSSAFITGTMVAFVPIMHRLINKAAIKANHVVSIIMVLAGLYVFTAPDTHGVNTGDVITLVSAAVWALYMTFIDRWTIELRDQQDKQNALVILQFLTTMLMAGIGSMALEDDPLRITWSRELVMGLLYCGIFASVIATWVQTRFQRFTHPVRAGIVFSTEPIFAAIIAWFAIDESFSSRQLAGAALLVAAVIVPDLLMARRETVREEV